MRIDKVDESRGESLGGERITSRLRVDGDRSGKVHGGVRYRVKPNTTCLKKMILNDILHRSVICLVIIKKLCPVSNGNNHRDSQPDIMQCESLTWMCHQITLPRTQGSPYIKRQRDYTRHRMWRKAGKQGLLSQLRKMQMSWQRLKHQS